MKRLLMGVIMAALMSLSIPTAAQGGKGDEPSIPPGAVYRFTDKDGNTEISSSLSEEAIEQGYEILNRKGMVIKEVPPALTEQERRALEAKKQRQRQKRRQQKRDEKLLRLYARPEDARRARDRQIKALEVNISYARNSLERMKEKLDREVNAAAKYERRGDKVPPSIRDSIEHYQSKIEEYKSEIAQYQRDIQEVRKKFRPIIERLKVIASDEKQKESAGAGGGSESGDKPEPIPSPAAEVN